IGTDQRRIDVRLHRGCFAIAGVAPGPTELAAIGASRLGQVEWIDVPAAPIVFRHDFAPAPRRTIAVALVDAATGESLRLQATDAERDGRSWRFDVVATEDPLQIGESDADVEASGNAR